MHVCCSNVNAASCLIFITQKTHFHHSWAERHEQETLSLSHPDSDELSTSQWSGISRNTGQSLRHPGFPFPLHFSHCDYIWEIKRSVITSNQLRDFGDGTKSPGAAMKQQDPEGLLKVRLCSSIFQVMTFFKAPVIISCFLVHPFCFLHTQDPAKLWLRLIFWLEGSDP